MTFKTGDKVKLKAIGTDDSGISESAQDFVARKSRAANVFPDGVNTEFEVVSYDGNKIRVKLCNGSMASWFAGRLELVPAKATGERKLVVGTDILGEGGKPIHETTLDDYRRGCDRIYKALGRMWI